MIETLTEYQRLNLLNQYKILRDLAEMRQDERTAQYYEELATIVAEGYLDSYDQLTQELNEEFPKEDCKLVWDTLRLYSAIYYSFNRLKNPKIKEADFHFDGFDGNTEFRYYHLCTYIINTLHRFGEFAENGITDFNSHCRRCDKYRKMLTKWGEMKEKFELNEEDIKYLIS